MYRTQPSASPDDIDIAALGRAIWSRWRLIAGLALATGGITYAALSFMTPLYTSEARILINNEETVFTRPAPASANEPLATRLAPDPEAVASQVQVLLSRDLALEVVRNLKLQQDPEFTRPSGLLSLPRQMLTDVGVTAKPPQAVLEERMLDNFFDRLSVYQISDSRVIAESFTSENPQTAADVSNKLAEVYLKWQQNEKLRQTRDATQWLSAQIEVLRKNVEDSEAKVEAFRTKTGLFAGQNNTSLDAQQLSELNSQLILARAQRTEAEARAKLIESMLKEGDVDASPDVLRSELIQRLLEKRVQVQGKLAEMSATLLPSHPRIRQLQAELSDLREQIRAEARKIVTSLQNEARIAGTREASLRESLNDMKQDSATSNANQIRLRALERDAKANRDLLESYLARYRDASARRDETSIPADASIISHAHASSVPSFPKKLPYSILAMVAVTLLSLAYILASELIRGQSIADPQDLQRRVDVAAANFATKPPENAPAETQAQQAAASAASPSVGLASISAAARRVLGKLSEFPRQRVLIVGEEFDASQEAIELARLLAKAAEQVALVDLTKKGGVAAMLHLPSAPGVCELASGLANFEQVVRVDPESAVQVFTGGNQRLFGPMREADEGLFRVLKALDQTYSCTLVLVDTEMVRVLAGPKSEHSVDWDLAVVIAAPLQESAAAPVPLDPSIETMRCEASAPSGAWPRVPFPRNLPFMRRSEATVA